MKRTVLAALLLLFSACASSKSSTNDGSTIGKGIDLETMRPPEAAQVVKEFQATYGIPPLPPPDEPVTSMAQVLEIVRQDRLSEFDEARRFASSRMGAEALTIRGYLELSYAGALMSAAWILEREGRQDQTELRQLSMARPLESGKDAQQDDARAAKLKAKVADTRKVVRALRVLSQEPLESGADLIKQAIAQDPKSQMAYLANANYYRLRGNWLEYDRMMLYADEGQADPPVRTFLRAMEAFERYVDPDRCVKLLRETLVMRPDLVRAQANLVLVSDGIDAKYAELEALKKISPTHIVVRLAGPMIEEEYETAKELQGAFAK
jgi:tetratricopeptide (TPR) repeat protein